MSLVFIAGCGQSEMSKRMKADWENNTNDIKISLAQQQFDEGKYDQAAAALNECRGQGTDTPQMHMLAGRLAIIDKNYQTAAAELQKAVKSNEKMHPAWYWLAVAEENLGDSQKAMEYFEKALLLDPENPDYVIGYGQALIAADRTDEAINLYRQKMQEIRNSVPLYIAAAQLYVKNSDRASAIDLLEEAALLKPDDPAIKENLAVCYISEGRHKDAQKVYVELLENNNSSMSRTDCMSKIADCAAMAGDYKTALRFYNRLAIDKRSDIDFWLDMGQAAIGADLPKKALSCAEIAAQISPGNPYAACLAGCAYYISGEYHAAINSFRSAAGDYDNASMAWSMIGRCYKKLGNETLAKQAFQKAGECEKQSKLLSMLENRK